MRREIGPGFQTHLGVNGTDEPFSGDVNGHASIGDFDDDGDHAGSRSDDGGNVHRNRRRPVGRWTVVAVGALLAVALAPHGAGAAPPDDTFEITTPGTDLSALDQGDDIAFEGTCWASGLGALDEAHVRITRQPGSGTPFFFSVVVSIDQGDGTFAGTLTVPDDAPDGEYILSLFCFQEDQVLEGPVLPAVIGDPVPPSTSSTSTTTTSTTTSTPDPADPIPAPSAPPAAPADPVAAAAALTG